MLLLRRPLESTLTPSVRLVHQARRGVALIKAIRSAASGRSAVIRLPINHPTILREYRSSATARYNQPSVVLVNVTSAAYTRFGAATSNCRINRLADHQLGQITPSAQSAEERFKPPTRTRLHFSHSFGASARMSQAPRHSKHTPLPGIRSVSTSVSSRCTLGLYRFCVVKVKRRDAGGRGVGLQS